MSGLMVITVSQDDYFRSLYMNNVFPSDSPEIQFEERFNANWNYQEENSKMPKTITNIEEIELSGDEIEQVIAKHILSTRVAKLPADIKVTGIMNRVIATVETEEEIAE